MKRSAPYNTPYWYIKYLVDTLNDFPVSSKVSSKRCSLTARNGRSSVRRSLVHSGGGAER